MIELRNFKTNPMSCALFCPECEKEYGTTVEVRLNFVDRSKSARRFRQKQIKAFEGIHGNHEEPPCDLYAEIEKNMIELRKIVEGKGESFEAALFDVLVYS